MTQFLHERVRPTPSDPRIFGPAADIIGGWFFEPRKLSVVEFHNSYFTRCWFKLTHFSLGTTHGELEMQLFKVNMYIFSTILSQFFVELLCNFLLNFLLNFLANFSPHFFFHNFVCNFIPNFSTIICTIFPQPLLAMFCTIFTRCVKICLAIMASRKWISFFFREIVYWRAHKENFFCTTFNVSPIFSAILSPIFRAIFPQFFP